MSLINKIDIDYKIFRGFSWNNQENLSELSKINIIFGWNGTGKSTITDIFYNIGKNYTEESEKKEAITIAQGIKFTPKVDFDNSPEKLSAPKIKVFNSNFVKDNISFLDGTKEADKILIIGEDNKEALEKYNNVIVELKSLNGGYKSINDKKVEAEGELETLLSNTAKQIKLKLQIKSDNEHLNIYSNYDKTKLKKYLLENKGKEFIELSDEDLFKKTNIVKENTKEILDLYNNPENADKEEIDLSKLPKTILEIVSTTVVSETIQRLSDNPELSQWIEKGLTIHEEKEDCEFCGNKLDQKRIEEYEKHFDKSYKDLTSRIEKGIDYLDNIKISNDLNKKSDFYHELQDEYDNDSDGIYQLIIEAIKNIKIFISNLKNELIKKKEKMFSKEDFDTDIFLQEIEDYNNAIDSYNSIITKHNKKTETLDTDKVSHALDIVDHVIFNNNSDLSEKNEKISGFSDLLNDKLEKIEEKQTEKLNIEADLINSKKPMVDINTKLKIYLGRDEIELEDDEKGYKIKRKGKEIKNDLSEGEKTAIAFLYFLQTLEDKDFNGINSLVVIDDPVTSMDENFIYSAYSFMKHSLNKVDPKQVIVLTHNITFLRFLKNGYGKYSNLYIIKNSINDQNNRFAYLEDMPKKMQKSFSSYYVLFEEIFRVLDQEDDVMPYANKSRQLLESFFAFKMPDIDLENCLSKYEEKGARVWRYCNTLSHHSRFPNEAHSVDTGEGYNVLQDVMDIIKSEDEIHYEKMSNVIDL